MYCTPLSLRGALPVNKSVGKTNYGTYDHNTDREEQYRRTGDRRHNRGDPTSNRGKERTQISDSGISSTHKKNGQREFTSFIKR